MFLDTGSNWIKACAIGGVVLLINGEHSPYILAEQHLHHMDRHVHAERPTQPIFASLIVAATTSTTASAKITKM